MKKVAAVSLFLVLLLSLTGCGGGLSDSHDGTSNNPKSSASVEPKTENESKTPEKIVMSETEFQDLLSQLPLVVTSTRYVVQDEQYKSLYPDMLQANLMNNTSVDIKNAVVAFAAWDANNLPVKIKGDIDFSGGTYVKQVNYSDINLVGGGTFGEKSGFSINADCNISKFVALAVSFETFSGETWENPYFLDWSSLYEGVKYTPDLSVTVTIQDAGFESSGGNNSVSTGNTSLSEEELLAEIGTQEVRVTSTDYIVQDKQYKSLYPDMLRAIIQNDTTYDIKNAVVAFVAWDKNNLPVKIKGSIDFSGGTYIKQVNYSDINLVPGASYGSSSGFEINENCNVENFKAIVVSYETFGGESWSNPHFDDWCKMYEGQKLS